MTGKLLIQVFILAVFLSFLSVRSLYGQGNAEYFFMNHRYGEALPLYIARLTPDSSDAFLNYRIGKCYLESRSQKERALPFLERAVQSFSSGGFNEPVALPLAIKDLGDACFFSGRYDCALESYDTLKKKYCSGAFTAGFLMGTDSLDICGEVNKRRDLSRLGKEISGSYGCPPDLLKKEYRFFEERMLTPDTVLPRHERKKDTMPLQFEATVAKSDNGQVVLIYKDDNGRAALYTIGLRQNNWTLETGISKSLNHAGWETDEFVSPDGNIMYFTSDRKGGFGGKDIYRCEKLPDGNWSRAENVGDKINSVYDEEAPFLYPDGTAFFFSSDRNDTGGFEVFVSYFSGTDGWTQPVSAGYPVISGRVATWADETPEAVASVKSEPDPGSVAKKKDKPVIAAPMRIHQPAKEKNMIPGEAQADEPAENFLISFYGHNKTPINLLKGGITDIYGKIPLQSKITVADVENRSSSVYIADSTGRYSIILPAGKNLNITFESEKYLFHSENIDLSSNSDFFELHNTIQLVPCEPGYEIMLNNIFFITGKTELSGQSLVELSNILSMLKKYPGMNAGIICAVQEPGKKAKENTALALGRARAIAEYLEENGIQKDRIKAGGSEKLQEGKTAGCLLRITGASAENH